MEYQIEITPLALELLSKIKDRREQQVISKRIEQLKFEPHKQGKALSGRLKKYRSIRVLGQRYRIVYQVNREKIVVVIVVAGIRKEGDKSELLLLLKPNILSILF